jgi:hypothetical protein
MTTTTADVMNGWEQAERHRKAHELALVALKLSEPLSIREWDERQWDLAQGSAGHSRPAGTETRYMAIRKVEEILEALEHQR